jgi:hypothetical protein
MRAGLSSKLPSLLFIVGLVQTFALDGAEKLFEGPEKATREGLNGSQLKFLAGTWPISQNQPEAPLF